ncbi:hypothetical protein R6Q59_012392 [Mikania micrantha]
MTATPQVLFWCIAAHRKLHASKVVENIGFGSVLNLKVDCIPTSLAFWLVQNYNEHTSALKLPGCFIHITLDLVNEVMRIPNGLKAVEEKRPSDKDVIVVELRSQFKNTAGVKRLFVMEFFKRVSQMRNANRKFILNFFVAFFNVVGETNKNSVVNQRFLTSLVLLNDIQKSKNIHSGVHVIRWLTKKTLLNLEKYLIGSDIDKLLKKQKIVTSDKTKGK